MPRPRAAGAKRTEAPVEKPQQPPHGLSPAELQALRIVIEGPAKKWRSQCPEGFSQAIDVILWVRGTIDVGGQQPTTKTDTPDTQRLVTFLLDAIPAPRRQAIIDEILAGYRNELLQLEHVQAMAKGLVEALTVRTPTTRSGNVGGKLEVTRLPAAAGSARRR